MTSETVDRSDLLHPDEMGLNSSWWISALALVAGVFLPMFYFCIVNTTLPAIGLDTGATTIAQLIISGLAAVYAIATMVGGSRAAHWQCRPWLFWLGVVASTLASISGGVTWSPKFLTGGCVLQGIAAIIMAPRVLASIRALLHSPDESRVLAIYAAAFGLAAISGELVGGMFALDRPYETAWQAVFLVNVLVGLMVFLSELSLLSQVRDRSAAVPNASGAVLISCFYLLFGFYFHAGLDQFRLVAVVTTLPFAVAFVTGCLVAGLVVRPREGTRLPGRFILQSFAFGAVILSLSAFLPERFGFGSICG
ncbi:MFS transporter [Bradyrhizobium sp. USDA 3256]